MILHISNCDSFIIIIIIIIIITIIIIVIIIIIIFIIKNFDSHYKEITGHASSFENKIM